MFETNELLYIGLLIGGLVLWIVISIFSNANNILRLGHLIGISVYMVLVFIFITHYAKLKTSRPQKYKQNLKKPFGDENCKQLTCVEPLKNTYEMMYLDNKADLYSSEKSDKSVEIYYTCSSYHNWDPNTDHNKHVKNCYINPNRKLSEAESPTKTGEIKSYNLFLYDYFIKSSFNSCASGDLQNDYLNIESLNLAIRLGCRFLDFEVYTINGVPCVATSTNRDSFHFKESLNHIPLEEVLKTVKENAMSSNGCNNHTDPLMLHFRIKTVQRSTYRKMIDLLNNLFGTAIITESDSEYSTTDDRSPFSLPIEYTFGRVFIIFNNYAGGDIFPVNFVLSDHMMNGDRGDIQKMRTAITTWSGDNHHRMGMYSKREYLAVLYTDETKEKQYSEMNKKACSTPDQPYAQIDLTYMFMEFPSNDTLFNPSYKIINGSIKNLFNFDITYNSKTKNKLENHKISQIVPICIQDFQLNHKNPEKDKEKGVHILIDQWWNFFQSALYDPYRTRVSDDDIRAVGLRQRIAKYKKVLLLADFTMPKNIDDRPINFWEEYTKDKQTN